MLLVTDMSYDVIYLACADQLCRTSRHTLAGTSGPKEPCVSRRCCWIRWAMCTYACAAAFSVSLRLKTLAHMQAFSAGVGNWVADEVLFQVSLLWL
jgi:hypothetical protein